MKTKLVLLLAVIMILSVGIYALAWDGDEWDYESSGGSTDLSDYSLTVDIAIAIGDTAVVVRADAVTAIGDTAVVVRANAVTAIGDSLDALRGNFQLVAPGSIANLSYSGRTITLTAGYGSTVIGQIVYIGTDGKIELTDKDVEATTGDCGLYVVLEVVAENATCLCLVSGIVRNDTVYSALAVGVAAWVGDAGVPTTTESTTTGDFNRVVGSSFSAHVLHFNPSQSWIKVK